MTIEIHNPELESIIQQRLRAGNFASVEDMLLNTFKEPQVAETAAAEAMDSDQTAKALAAADRIRELRKGVTLDRPAGMSLREYVHIGHRY